MINTNLEVKDEIQVALIADNLDLSSPYAGTSEDQVKALERISAAIQVWRPGKSLVKEWSFWYWITGKGLDINFPFEGGRQSQEGFFVNEWPAIQVFRAAVGLTPGVNVDELWYALKILENAEELEKDPGLQEKIAGLFQIAARKRFYSLVNEALLERVITYRINDLVLEGKLLALWSAEEDNWTYSVQETPGAGQRLPEFPYLVEAPEAFVQPALAINFNHIIVEPEEDLREIRNKAHYLKF